MLLSVSKNISLFLFLLLPVLAESQAIFSPGNAGMGDNGTTHLTDSQVGFINPANLMLFDGPGHWNVNLLQGGHYYNKGFTSVYFNSPRNYFTPFDSKSTEFGFRTIDDANQIIRKWYGNDQMRSNNENMMDIQTIGISYKSQNYAIAFNHRIRGKSLAEIGRGWYDATFKNMEDHFILDRTLNQKLEIWHEISAAIAWEQDLISGLLGSRSNLFIGINPKILLPIAHVEHQLQSNYTWNESNPMIQNYSHRYVGYVTGDYAQTIKSRITHGNPSQLVGIPDYFSINGVGLGFDAGLTWRIIMGERIRIKSDQRIDSNYHISLSVSVQDIGFVSYQNESAILTSSKRVPTIDSTISAVDREHTGAMSDFAYFSTFNDQEFYNNLSLDESSINRLLPSSITAGIGLKLDQVLFAIEYKQHSNNVQWQSDFSTLHIGNEITLFSVFDIRSGVILHSNEPVTLSAGVGLDTPYFSLSAGTYARQIANTNDFRPVLMNVGAVSVRF